MSPEQARGDALDGRTDLFAAGIICWELLAGKKLYRGGDLIAKARAAEVPELESRGLPNESALFAIVKRALSPDRDARFATAGAMRAALLDYIASAKLTANPIRFGELDPLRRRDRRATSRSRGRGESARAFARAARDANAFTRRGGSLDLLQAGRRGAARVALAHRHLAAVEGAAARTREGCTVARDWRRCRRRGRRGLALESLK